MATKSCFFLFAFFCVVNCNPLGQTTFCESTPNLPLLPSISSLPVAGGLGSTTVCESTPNIGYGIGGYGLGHGLPYGGLGSTTVCESVPNRALGIGYLPGYAGILPYASGTTVCESVPNVLGYNNLGIAHPNLGYAGLGSTTVCESSPTFHGGLGLGYAGLGLPVGPVGAVGLGSATVCETTPNLGFGLGGLSYPGIVSPYGYGGLGYGVPFL